MPEAGQVVHTRGMNTIARPNGDAPGRKGYRLGQKGGTTAAAWQYVWDRLSSSEFQDGHVLAELAAQAYEIQPDSVRAQMYVAAREGHLEIESRLVPMTATRHRPISCPVEDQEKGLCTLTDHVREFETRRRRTFYRIKSDA